MPSLFQRRHYEWLARFAGQHLDKQAYYALSGALNRDNPNFDAQRFIRACDRCRDLAHAPTQSIFKQDVAS